MITDRLIFLINVLGVTLVVFGNSWTLGLCAFGFAASLALYKDLTCPHQKRMYWDK